MDHWTPQQHGHPDPRRWKALALLCTAFFMKTVHRAPITATVPSTQNWKASPVEVE